VNGRVAVIYYSATGNVHALAQAVADGAEEAGAEVRRRHVEELASELLISQDQYWGRHRSVVSDEPVAALDELEWADGVAFGTPTRFGKVAAQLKQFIDQAGRLWQEGKLADKVATTFTSSQTPHGGQESTILALNTTLYHWGMVIVPLGYTVNEVFASVGNPYGTSYTAGDPAHRSGRECPRCRALSGPAAHPLRNRHRRGAREERSPYEGPAPRASAARGWRAVERE
jgi:NAD(P)H dehydrogenase (quinone)